MKLTKYYIVALLAFALAFTACDEEDTLLDQQLADNPLPPNPPDPSGSAGALNLSNYVAIGNSLTAGFQDNALYTDGQSQSFPALLGQQFQISGIGGGTFNQPDINSANGLSGIGSQGELLGRLVLNLTVGAPEPTVGEAITAFAGDKSALNNFGVPGAAMGDLINPNLAAANPLYQRFATDPGTSTVLGDALATSPTFYTVWAGNNDVLRYAVSGGTNDALLTPAQTFTQQTTAVLGQLAGTGSPGIVINIPPIVVNPFFRAVRWNAVPLDAATAAALNAGFEGFNLALAGLVQAQLLTQADLETRSVSYAAGNNPVLIYDETLTDIGPLFDILEATSQISAAQRAALEPYRQSRPATSNDLMLLTAATEIGRELGGPTLLAGISIPLGDRFTLTETEVATVVTQRVTLNIVLDRVITGVNTQAGAPVLTKLDIQPFFADLFGLTSASAAALVLSQEAQDAADGVLGIMVEGFNLRPDFTPDGVFSTDGLHPNPRGHAIIANAIIEKMNATYGSQIPLIEVLALRGVLTQ